MEDVNLFEVAAANDDFQLLVAIVSDLGLMGDLMDPGADLTIFAPTDQAFANLAVLLGYAGGTDVSSISDLEDLTTFFTDQVDASLLQTILNYHLVEGSKDATTIDGLDTLSTLSGGSIDLGNFSILDGTFSLGDEDATIVDPNVIAPDLTASNGVIHGIDNVLLPLDLFDDDPKSLFITAAMAGDFKLLIAIIGFLDTEAAPGDINLMPALMDEASALTVFAPTDQAFANLAVTLGFTKDDGTAPDVTNISDLEDLTNFFEQQVGAETLREIVLYHLVDGTKDAEDIDTLASGDEDLTTLGGGLIDLSEFSLASGMTELVDLDLNVVNPNVSTPDVIASNGIIHVLDNVLLPKDLLGDDNAPNIFETIVELSGPEGFDDNGEDFDFLREAVIAADLVDPLSTLDLTAFAPTDAAFMNLVQALNYDGEDEAGGFGYLVDALRLLNLGDDPIDLLTTVLTYHLSSGGMSAADLDAAGSVVTLQGGSITVNGTTLIDADPDFPNQQLILTDLLASNGVIHVSDGVLLPIDILVSDGSNDVDFIIGDDDRGWYNTGEDNDYIDGRGGRDVIISGSGNDVVLAGDGRDFVNAGMGDDFIKGEGGNDKIIAGSGDDFVDGGDGRDWIFGGKGNDIIAGGKDDDWLLGGLGDDIFVFDMDGGHDTISAFESGHDKIDLTAYGFAGYGDIAGSVVENKRTTEIDLGDTVITVEVFKGLSEDDFIFV